MLGKPSFCIQLCCITIWICLLSHCFKRWWRSLLMHTHRLTLSDPHLEPTHWYETCTGQSSEINIGGLGNHLIGFDCMETFQMFDILIPIFLLKLHNWMKPRGSRDIVLMRRLRWWLPREMERYQPSGLWALWATALMTEAAQTLPSRPNNDQLEDGRLASGQWMHLVSGPLPSLMMPKS